MPAYGQYSSYNPAIKASRNSGDTPAKRVHPFTGRPAQTQPGAAPSKPPRPPAWR